MRAHAAVHKNNNFKGSIYMVFDYADYDLTGLMESQKYCFTEPQVRACVAGGSGSLWCAIHAPSQHPMPSRGKSPIRDQGRWAAIPRTHPRCWLGWRPACCRSSAS